MDGNCVLEFPHITYLFNEPGNCSDHVLAVILTEQFMDFPFKQKSIQSAIVYVIHSG